MIKLKTQGSVSREMPGSLYSEKWGSVSREKVGSVCAFFPTYEGDPTKENYSTSAPVLKKIRSEHPIIDKILLYRKYKALKQISVKLPTLKNIDTQRVHTNFNQAIAATGRLSSSKPNLQSIPNSKGDSKLLRGAIIPSIGNRFIVADYSQIELRIMAHLSNDKALIDAYSVSGTDIHKYTASLIFNTPMEDIGDNDYRRTIAKTVNFGLNYGMGAKTLADKLNAETGTEYEKEDAQEWIDNFFERYSGVEQFRDDQVDFASANGFTLTMKGRKRYFPEIGCGIGQERTAVNFPIQGSAADIMKIAMIKIHNRLSKENRKAKMVLSVHDEVVLDTPESEVAEVEKLVKEEMESAMVLCIPLIAEVKVGTNWLDAKSK